MELLVGRGARYTVRAPGALRGARANWLRNQIVRSVLASQPDLMISRVFTRLLPSGVFSPRRKAAPKHFFLPISPMLFFFSCISPPGMLPTALGLRRSCFDMLLLGRNLRFARLCGMSIARQIPNAKKAVLRRSCFDTLLLARNLRFARLCDMPMRLVAVVAGFPVVNFFSSPNLHPSDPARAYRGIIKLVVRRSSLHE